MNIRLPGFNQDFPDWSNVLNYADTYLDQEDMTNLNDSLIKTGLNIKKINSEMEKYDRLRTAKELEYKRKFRREFQEAQGTNATQKKIIAEINCEELESELRYYENVVNELTRMSAVLRTDLDILKTIGFNLRQELKI